MREMKQVLNVIAAILAMIGTWGCSTTGAYHASGTLIGVEVGTPEIGSLSIGYRNFEVTVVTDKSSADIGSTALAGTNGLDVTKRTVFNLNEDLAEN